MFTSVHGFLVPLDSFEMAVFAYVGERIEYFLSEIYLKKKKIFVEHFIEKVHQT